MNRKRKSLARRQGAAAAEFAVVLPVFMLMIVGAIELFHMNICKSILINKAREAARLAINVNASDTTISTTTNTQVASLLSTSSNAITCTIRAKAPNGTLRSSFSAAQQGDLIEVELSVPYNQVSIFASGLLSNSQIIREICIMQKE